MNRREFLSSTVAATAAASLLATDGSPVTAAENSGKRRFKLKYAPHFGMFRQHGGNDPVDQLKFIADQGFQALEDNGMGGRPKEEQERIAREMQRLGMQMGVFVASFGPNIASDDKSVREQFVNNIRGAVEVAKRVNAKWCTVVPGNLERRLQMDFQTAYVIEALKEAAAVCEPSGLVMVLEPLSDNPDLFLRTSDQAYAICRAVDSPSCKILYDMYHMQRNEGDIVAHIDHAWSEIAYFQIGDNPGRKEPGTGEMNYRHLFRHIRRKGFDGIFGMEHGNAAPGKEGEQALIDAYVAADSFELGA